MTTRHPSWTAFGVAAGLFLCAPVASATEGIPSLNPVQAVGKATLKGFLERPLFDPSRRLPPVVPPQPILVAAPVAAPPEPPPTLHLLGVIQGVRDMAVVHRDGEEKTVILRTGDRVGDWRVTVLPSLGIRLHQGSRFYDYAMFVKSAGSVPVAVAQTDLSGRMELSEAMTRRNARLRKRTY